ncbi:MAG TPA: hypothetical protein VEX18_10545, partial [Polyangiaceae bacterium]|nr:hypothetical protein [Polyangiaceae bacterium]
MSNLKLVPDEPTPLEKLLLDASRNEMPSAEHKANLRAALGLGLGPPLSQPPPASTAFPAAASAPLASAPLAAPVVVLAKSTSAAKVALGVGALAVAGALWFTSGSEPKPVAPARPAVASKPVEAPAPVIAVPTVETQPAVSSLPPVAQAAPARPTRSDSSANVVEDLSEQIRLIEAARAGVASHDVKVALLALNSYSSKFPRGSFGQEATV